MWQPLADGAALFTLNPTRPLVLLVVQVLLLLASVLFSQSSAESLFCNNYIFQRNCQHCLAMFVSSCGQVTHGLNHVQK